MARRQSETGGTALQSPPGEAAEGSFSTPAGSSAPAVPGPLTGGEYGAAPVPRGKARPKEAGRPENRTGSGGGKGPIREPEPEAEASEASGGQLFVPLTLLGIVAAVFLLVCGITARVTLVQLSEEGLAMEARLEELEREQTRLRIAYESAFNLGRVETYAREVLGMRKPSADQIIYIDTSRPDRAQVFTEPPRDGFVDRLSDLLTGLGAYFGLTGE